MESLRVLVINQDEALGMDISRLIASLGHTATLAISGEEALMYLQALPLDVVLADSVLPDLSPAVLIERIQATWPERSIVLCTADASPSARLDLLRCGACDVVLSPLEREWVEVALRRAANQMELTQLRTKDPASSVAHQLALKYAHAINNPLSSILGLVQLLLVTPDLPEEMREDLQLIADNTNRLAQIVKHLAQTSHLDTSG